MDSDSDNEPSDSDDSSTSAAAEERWRDTLQMIKGNDPQQDHLIRGFNEFHIQNMTDKEWEELGRDIANNTHLTNVHLSHGWLNDHKISCLFRGLTRSSYVKNMHLHNNELSAAAVRSMVPFLQNANNLQLLDLSGNTIQSEGFNMLFRALRDSPIEEIQCCYCGIESVEIDSNQIPKYLKRLYINANNINSDGCRELAKLLQGDSTLRMLFLRSNKIDDEGVEILVEALKSNITLEDFDLKENQRISRHGNIMLLKLVNDISSIEATLQSNHTLRYFLCADDDDLIQDHISIATKNFNCYESNPYAAGREKVIWTQLNSKTRAELAELQEVNHSVYSEIEPLHLPEVLALVDEYHGQSELYIALKSSIAGVISTVNKKVCIRQQMAYHQEKLKELSTELAAIEAAEGGQGDSGGRNKRHRAC